MAVNIGIGNYSLYTRCCIWRLMGTNCCCLPVIGCVILPAVCMGIIQIKTKTEIVPCIAPCRKETIPAVGTCLRGYLNFGCEGGCLCQDIYCPAYCITSIQCGSRSLHNFYSVGRRHIYFIKCIVVEKS